MLPLLRKSKSASIVNVSSIMGSLAVHAANDSPLAYTRPFAYDASKAAVNAFTIHLAAAVAAEGIVVNSVHPGWVRTELGTDSANLSIEEGAKPVVDVALAGKRVGTAKFLHGDSELPW